jgi:hypothetical protein
MFETPVLFLIFNRPDLTQKVFAVIKHVKPRKLFIAADGPRPDRIGEDELCKETRELVLSMVDWDCEVKTLFRESNLGCKLAVSGAIDWFFEQVEQGIIIEDDCLPDLSFFSFCEAMLEHHKDSHSIMHIAGNNFLRNKIQISGSYYLSIYTHIWGWATWSRSWNKYDRDIVFWPKLKQTDFLNNFFNGNKTMAGYWTAIFDSAYDKAIDNWDAQWLLSCWVHGGAAVIPVHNLVDNIGFRDDATHTKNPGMRELLPIVQSLDKLVHGGCNEINTKADNLTFHHLFRPDLLHRKPFFASMLSRIKQIVKRYIFVYVI